MEIRNHCVNLVTFDGQKYLVDVAMGPTTPAPPMLLSDNIAMPGIGASTCRLRWDTIPDYLDPESKLWIYEQNNDGKSDFVPTYCFSELEFLPNDYEVMKAGTTFNRKSWFTWRLVCVRTVLDEDENVVGLFILTNDSLKKRIMGKTEHIATFSCEAERIAALSGYFGIELNDDEKDGIKGMVTALPDRAPQTNGAA
jgi:arylamine N-acetyltransferase